MHGIERVVKALRVAKALPHVPAETGKAKRELTAAKNAVRVLRKRFAQDHRAKAENLRRGLAWAEKDLELSEVFVRFGFDRRRWNHCCVELGRRLTATES